MMQVVKNLNGTSNIVSSPICSNDDCITLNYEFIRAGKGADVEVSIAAQKSLKRFNKVISPKLKAKIAIKKLEEWMVGILFIT